MSSTLNEDLIQEIREKNEIVGVISQYIRLKKTGANYKALCPFHNEKTPSFVVSPSKQIFHCFGCGVGGDVISFIMRYENLDFKEAIKILADRAGIEIDESNMKKNIELERRKNRLYQINREAARYFYYNLQKNSRGYNYFRKRGVSSNTIKIFGLGYANPEWNDLLKYLVSKGYSEEELLEAGLVIEKKNKNGFYDRFRDRVMFPIVNTRGKVIGFGGRVLDDSVPKYLNSPDTLVFSKGNNLFGLNLVYKNSKIDKILLVEGYMDVISLYNKGIVYSVASLGTAFTESQCKMLKRWNDSIYICYDSDDAGLKASNKALDLLKRVGFKPRVIILPDGLDPDEYINKFGKELFENLFTTALDYIDFKILYYRNKFDINTVQGKVDFIKNISQDIKNISSPVERDVYINRVSDEVNISVDAIKREIFGIKGIKTRLKDKYINANYRDTNKSKIVPVENVLEPGHLTAEKSLLNLLISDEYIYEKIKEDFSPDDFLDPMNRKIAELVYDNYRKGKKITKQEIIDNFSNSELDKLNEILAIKINFDDSEKEKAVDDYLKKINYYKLKIKRKQIREKIKLIESKKVINEGEEEELKELCLELMEVDKALKLHCLF
ncbi:DNA primase [Caloranaerobacter azorensis H53214]|uniref:DNA primase n=1 Tax=Caloranaerobacter azorensis H53214 TaxID=1156417 RepID=A0A096BHD8_9FIRM|nr:DNA primase [Caloranaerobacter azorensis]KGG80168.1 DNA primase [Caloranaerobacter azorensis H53214]